MKVRDRKRIVYSGRGRDWGRRCSDYATGCVVCEAWRFFDERGRFPRGDELLGVLEREEALQRLSALSEEIGLEL